MVLQRWPFFAYEGTAYQVYSTGAGTGSNMLPITKLTVSPAAVTTVPAIVTLTADATDPDGVVSRVEYYLGADKIGETAYAAAHDELRGDDRGQLRVPRGRLRQHRRARALADRQPHRGDAADEPRAQGDAGATPASMTASAGR